MKNEEAIIELSLHKDKDCKHSVRYAGADKDGIPFTIYVPRKWLNPTIPEAVKVSIKRDLPF